MIIPVPGVTYRGKPVSVIRGDLMGHTYAAIAWQRHTIWTDDGAVDAFDVVSIAGGAPFAWMSDTISIELQTLRRAIVAALEL